MEPRDMKEERTKGRLTRMIKGDRTFGPNGVPVRFIRNENGDIVFYCDGPLSTATANAEYLIGLWNCAEESPEEFKGKVIDIVRDYHYELEQHKHNGILAAIKALERLEKLVGVPWDKGAETVRRKIDDIEKEIDVI